MDAGNAFPARRYGDDGMIIELTYDGESNEFCIYRGCDLLLHTKFYHRAIKRFTELCDQLRGVKFERVSDCRTVRSQSKTG